MQKKSEYYVLGELIRRRRTRRIRRRRKRRRRRRRMRRTRRRYVTRETRVAASPLRPVPSRAGCWSGAHRDSQTRSADDTVRAVRERETNNGLHRMCVL